MTLYRNKRDYKLRAILILICLFFITCDEKKSEINIICIDSAKLLNKTDCPAVYDPVCGCDKKNYSNSCFAQAAGLLEWNDGVCN